MKTEMTSSDEPKKTKKQIKKSAVASILCALFMSIFPLELYMEYRKYGFIRTGKAGFIASGDMAHSMIYGMTGAVAFMWIMAVYIAVQSMMKIKRGEYSEIDEEFVICRNCGEPQRSKELVAGHCFKCTGTVECLEGYYDRHPELKPESHTPPLQELSHATFITCTRCEKTYYCKDRSETLCQDCRTT